MQLSNKKCTKTIGIIRLTKPPYLCYFAVMDKMISPFAEFYDGSPRDTKDQILPAQLIVVHITGRATYLNAQKKKVPPLRHLGEYFDKAGNPFSHYSVDPWGRISCHAPETETPYAQGWKAYKGRAGLISRLKKGTLKLPAWWKKYWAALSGDKDITPASLVRSDCYSGNDRSVAIEFIQCNNQYKLTVAQYVWGSVLVGDIARRHEIEINEFTLLGHEDLDPWGRGTATGGWDPGARRPAGQERFSFQGLTNPTYIVEGNIAIPTPPVPDWAR